MGISKDMESIVTGRSNSLFAPDMEAHGARIRESLASARILVIGAAGSIGGAFSREIAGYRLRGLHLVDIAENNLAEVVRDFRSGGAPLPEDFQTLALDFSSCEMQAFLKNEKYDYVLNFSALKHVRSERDPYTLMRMLVTNVIANDWLMDWCDRGRMRRFFAVSSDKAVRPASLMGASKAFMERVLLSRASEVSISSARFANVAYSDGSLLHGLNLRIAKRQPVSAPTDVRRYFISHREAAQLCILASVVGGTKEIFYPKAFRERDALSFAEIARLHLVEQGLEPMEFESAEEAVAFMKHEPADSRRWACHFSHSDTSGEKMIEEFVGEFESTDDDRLSAVGIVTHPTEVPRAELVKAMAALLELRQSLSWTKQDMLEVVSCVVPELKHVETERNLDQKM